MPEGMYAIIAALIAAASGIFIAMDRHRQGRRDKTVADQTALQRSQLDSIKTLTKATIEHNNDVAVMANTLNHVEHKIDELIKSINTYTLEVARKGNQ